MADETDREVRVTFAEGVREDIASLTAASDDDDRRAPPKSTLSSLVSPRSCSNARPTLTPVS
jgi:hypothetical protein